MKQSCGEEDVESDPWLVEAEQLQKPGQPGSCCYVLFMDTQYLNSDKLIPNEKLTPTTAMYWRVFAKFFAEQDGPGAEEYLGSILPELTPFCLYVRRYILELEKVEDVKWDFMVKELISMTTIYDLGDEVGRKNLCKLIKDLLTSTKTPVICIIPEPEGLRKLLMIGSLNNSPKLLSRLLHIW